MAGEPCLIYDNGVGDQEWIFIFASEIGLQLLREFNIGTLMGLLRFALKFSANFIPSMDDEMCISSQ